jgi:hypothetical protein
MGQPGANFAKLLRNSRVCSKNSREVCKTSIAGPIPAVASDAFVSESTHSSRYWSVGFRERPQRLTPTRQRDNLRVAGWTGLLRASCPRTRGPMRGRPARGESGVAHGGVMVPAARSAAPRGRDPERPGRTRFRRGGHVTKTAGVCGVESFQITPPRVLIRILSFPARIHVCGLSGQRFTYIYPA